MDTIEVDLVIVGGGPAGCTCALYSARAELNTVVLDKNPAVGALAITHQIANYPGVSSEMSGEALLDLMRDQAITYGTKYFRSQVFGVDVSGDFKTVYTPDATYKAKALVLATGAMGRQTTFKGEDTYLGRGVSYCATCDGAFYRNREVAVVGVNQEAIEEALVLTKFASTVHWITPTEPKDDDPHAQGLLAEKTIKHWGRSRLVSINGDENGVTGIDVKSRPNNTIESLPVEGVFVYAAGSKPITDFLGDQIELNEDGGVKVNEMMATSVEGVWAIGDIRNTPFKQAVVAAADGCIAAMAIDRYLNSRKSIKVDWIHA
ncbi:MAG: NAD(P)/FAD-dependent oxidoreductase [Prochlorococcus sp.]